MVGWQEPLNIKLVIWDLDDTFWRGTLSEGPIEPIEENLASVRALASRGVMSSICSKNDFQVAERKLRELEIWDYFIFPSINWEPKGPRVSALLETAGLRAENTLMLDDSSINLKEIAHFNPGICVQLPEEWQRVDHSAWGKNDEKLTRLAQYRLLEKKQVEKCSFIGSNHEFLRGCEIKVVLAPVCEDDFSRIFELVERTNQLNYTKTRHSAGFSEFVFYLNHRALLSYKIYVTDRFGDYGLSGFVSIDRSGALKHFLFSCRLLGMHVENAVYQFLIQKLAHTKIQIRKPTFSNKLAVPAEWITLTEIEMENKGPPVNGPRVLFAASCFGQALVPFLSRKFNVDCTYSMYGFDLGQELAGDTTFPIMTVKEDREKLKALFSGDYDYLVLHWHEFILFHTSRPLLGRLRIKLLTQPFFSDDRKHAELGYRAASFGGNFLGREFPEPRSFGARVAGWALFRILRDVLDPTARRYFKRHYRSKNYRLELDRLLKKLPEKTTLVVFTDVSNSYSWPEDPRGEALLREQQRRLNEALKELSVVSVPVTSVADGILSDGIHYSHEGFVKLATLLSLRIEGLY